MSHTTTPDGAAVICHDRHGICHAVWTCGCDTWDVQGVEEGSPWHEGGIAVGVRCWGRFSPSCHVRVNTLDGTP